MEQQQAGPQESQQEDEESAEKRHQHTDLCTSMMADKVADVVGVYSVRKLRSIDVDRCGNSDSYSDNYYCRYCCNCSYGCNCRDIPGNSLDIDSRNLDDYSCDYSCDYTFDSSHPRNAHIEEGNDRVFDLHSEDLLQTKFDSFESVYSPVDHDHYCFHWYVS